MQRDLLHRNAGLGDQPELAKGGHVEMEAGLAGQARHGLAEKGLGGEGHRGRGGFVLEGLPVLNAASAQGLLVDHVEGRPMVSRQLDGVAAAHLEMPLFVDSLCSK